MAKYKCIGCEVLARPLYFAAAVSANVVDIVLVQRALHNEPARLREGLQHHIDAAAAEAFDAVLLGYGLCGKAIEGLQARGKPLVVPRAHDCITLFLGSRDRYQAEFDREPGTFWYVQDYLERGDPGSALLQGAGSESELSAVYDEYVERYGEDNALYLMEVMGAWRQHYRRAAYIELPVADSTAVERQAREDALSRGWNFERLQGELTLIRRLLDGDWADDFLVLNPGEAVAMGKPHEVIVGRARG